MIYGRLNPATGELTDVADRDQTSGDVPVAAMPAFVGPYGYDTPSKSAVPLPKASQTDVQKLSGSGLGLSALQCAVLLRLSSTWASSPASVQARVQALIDAAAAKVLAALS